MLGQVAFGLQSAWAPYLAVCAGLPSFPRAMNVTDVKKEITAVGSLILARRESFSTCASGAADKTKEAALVNNLSYKIQRSLVCSIAEAQGLYECLKATNLEEAFKEDLRNSIDNALASVATNAMPVALKPQKLVHIHNYLTQSDWATIGSPDVSYIAKLNCMAQRWRSLGIRSLHEQTAKYGVAVILCHLGKLPDHGLINQMVLDLKSSFQSIAPEAIEALPYVKEFPQSHTQLPKEIIANAYHDQEPAPKELEQLKPILKHIALRSTSKLLKGKHAPTPSAASQPSQGHANFGSGSSPMPMQNDAMCGMMMQMSSFFQSMKEQMAFMQGNSSQSMAAPSSSGGLKLSPGKQQKALEDFQPKPRQAALALEDKHAANTQKADQGACQAQLPVDSHQHNDEQLGTTAEDYENATFNRLKARADGKKKNTGTTAAKKAAPEKKKKDTKTACGKEKKPKAKAKTSLKRPASAMSSAGKSKGSALGQADSNPYIIPELQAHDLEVARNVYVSRHYSKARVHARGQLKMAEDEAKEYGRRFLREAGALWDAAKKKLESQ